MQSAPPAEAQQWAQEQQAYKDSVRTSTPATIQNALQNFNGVQINPSKLYAPGAPTSNTAPLSPEQQPQAQARPVATPQALGPATVVCEHLHTSRHSMSLNFSCHVVLENTASGSSWSSTLQSASTQPVRAVHISTAPSIRGWTCCRAAIYINAGMHNSCAEGCGVGAADGKGPKGYVSGSAPVGSQMYLPAQAAQNSAQAAVPATGLSQANYQQDNVAGVNSASQHSSSQAAAPAAYSDAAQAASSQTAAPAAYTDASQAGSSQAAAPAAYSDASQAALSQAAAPVAFYGNSQVASSQTAAPVAYSSASDAAASGTDAAGASPATSVPNSRLNPGQQCHHIVNQHGFVPRKP